MIIRTLLCLTVTISVLGCKKRVEALPKEGNGESLPVFKYHPNPIKTGVIEKSSEKCECCGKARGYLYTASFYAEKDIERICPWCIASGEAAEKLNGAFVDSLSLDDSGIKSSIIDEVCRRTPGYSSWQQEVWLTCCKDACEFHGDASKKEMKALTEAQLAVLASDIEFEVAVVKKMIDNYTPQGSLAFYRFVCRHCKKVKYHCDFN